MSRNAKSFTVYIMGSRSLNFYVGFTRDLMGRVWRHKTGIVADSSLSDAIERQLCARWPAHSHKYFKDCHTAKYNIVRLLYFEHYRFSAPAIDREKQLKPWSKVKKLALIRTLNPNLEDLAKDWYPELNAGPSTRREKTAARSG